MDVDIVDLEYLDVEPVTLTLDPGELRRYDATLDRLAATPEARLAELFGDRLGPQLARLARFEDDRPLQTARVRKSESRERTFDRDLRGLGELEPVLARLARELCDELAEHRRSGRTVGIKVRFDDFSTVTRARTVAEPTADPALVGAVALELLRELAPERPVRLLGVRAPLDLVQSVYARADDRAQVGAHHSPDGRIKFRRPLTDLLGGKPVDRAAKPHWIEPVGLDVPLLITPG